MLPQAYGNKKDRYTVLSPRLLEELRAYWRLYRPKDLLFPSPLFPDRPLTRGAVERAFTDAVERAGLPDRGGIHSLRKVSSWCTTYSIALITTLTRFVRLEPTELFCPLELPVPLPEPADAATRPFR